MHAASTVILLSVGNWDFDDDKGKNMAGSTVWYCDPSAENPKDTRGVLPMKGTLMANKEELTRKIANAPVPCVINIAWGTQATTKGPKMVISDIEVVGPIDLKAAIATPPIEAQARK